MNVSELGETTAAGFRNVATLAATVSAADAAASATLALDNVGSADADPEVVVQGESLSTVNVAGSLNAAADDLEMSINAGAGVETVMLNSEVDVLLTAIVPVDAEAPVTGLDASGSTGDIIYLVGEDVDTLMGGAGDDAFIFEEPGQLGLWTSVDGGDGFDAVALANEVFQTQDYDAINQLENIEALAFTGEDVTLDAAQVSDFEVLAFGDLEGVLLSTATVSNLSSEQLVVIGEDDTIAMTLVGAAADTEFLLEEDSPSLLPGDETTLLLEIDNTSADTIGATGGELAVAGEGNVLFSNVDGKYSVIDAEWLEGDLMLGGMAAGVEETVVLGEDTISQITLDIVEGGASSSSIGAMDMVVGFDEEQTALMGFDSTEELMLSGDVSTLQQAFAEAAAAYGDTDVLYFHFEGDTFVYADTVDAGAGRYDNGDFALQIAGEHDIEPFVI